MNTCTEINTCPYCKGIHTGICWMVKSVEYFPNGMIKRVELREQAIREAYTYTYPPNRITTWCGA
jgi:hypothetical protein